MAHGVEKELELYKKVRCSVCEGSGVEPGSKKVECATCKGEGQIRTNRRTILGTFQQAAFVRIAREKEKFRRKNAKNAAETGECANMKK